MQRINHSSEYGRWTLYRKRPETALRPYVQEMQGYREFGGRPVSRAEVPTCIVPIIFVLDAGFSVETGTVSRPLGRSFAAGFTRKPTLIGSGGDAFCIQVDLTPLGAMRLLGPALADLTDHIVDLADIDATFCDGLESRLVAQDGWAARFCLVENWLTARLMTGYPDDQRLRVALAALGGASGEVRIAPLSERLGISRKHLHQLFKSRLGLSPKTYMRIARFQRAANDLRSAKASIAAVAAANGYADQAHLTREFRAFSGLSPIGYLRGNLPDGTGLMADADSNR